MDEAREGERRRDKAIEIVARGAPGFVHEALSAVLFIAERRETFTTDLVWKVLRRRGVDMPDEPRAMGAVMRRACTAGVIEATEEWRLSKRAACHRRPLRVWRSLL